MAGMWVALHDTEQGMGRLQLLPGSHKQGVRTVKAADGGEACNVKSLLMKQHVSDVERGDVIIFHSCCVHRAEPNTSESTVRLSIDTRFCNYMPVFISNLDHITAGASIVSTGSLSIKIGPTRTYNTIGATTPIFLVTFGIKISTCW